MTKTPSPCRCAGVPMLRIYNGSRRNGLDLLRVESMPFDNILFTATERFSLHGEYCGQFEEFTASYDRKISRDSLSIRHPGPARTVELVQGRANYLTKYLGTRLKMVLALDLERVDGPGGSSH